MNKKEDIKLKMKKHKNRIVAGIILGILILMSVVPAMADEPSITLNPMQPTTAGSIGQISWSYIGSFEPNVKLELLKDGILNRTIIFQTPLESSYYWWAIPLSLEGLYQVKTTARTTTDQEVTNVTDIEITTPTEQGCRVCHQTTGTVMTGYNNTLGSMPTRHHSLVSRMVINPVTNTPFGCADCHPDQNTGHLFVEYNCLNCHNGTAFWANPSVINPGEPHNKITVTAPRGGENWETGTTQTIRWNYIGNFESNTTIELLKNGIVNQTWYASASNGVGSYEWIIPQSIAEESYKIRISMTSTTGETVSDTSGFFNIIVPEITVTAPGTGDKWLRGTTQTIRWNYVGDIGNYATIELLEQGRVDQTWNDVPQSNGVGSYDWAIPSDFKVSIYQIRVSVGGLSNTTGNFRIVRK